MAYFEDLSFYSYYDRFGNSVHNSEFKILNIGWIETDFPFTTGDAPIEFIEKLEIFCKPKIFMLRGVHFCDLCELSLEGELSEFGVGEIRVFGRSNKIYAAPTLISHYVTCHSYLPPDEFIQAVLESSLPGESTYMAQFQKAFPLEFRELREWFSK